MSGLLNYYGRTPESDNIAVKPVLLQKGNTKLALYGLSNVRDERLFRTFRDGKVKFFTPTTQKDDWFNLMSVHQNHHAYTDTGYLPEHFLPDFADLVIWGHEHECLIDPRTNPVMNFRVMQPGSTVATSLVPGEAVPKHVAIVSVYGKDMEVETIRLKSVRPFKYKEITLADDRRMRDIANEHENKAKVHSYLTDIINEMIKEANEEWLDLQRDSQGQLEEGIAAPLPLIRLRVECTAPEGGDFQIENPQRFSKNRFLGTVANTADVLQTHRKRTAARKINQTPDMPEAQVMAQLSLENVKVEKLVEEFLTAQSLSILPQNPFSDAVGQFVDKDDKHAMEEFVKDALKQQEAGLVGEGDGEVDEDQLAEMMEKVKANIETAFAKGELKRSRKRKPKPLEYDSEEEGPWEDHPDSIIRSDPEDAEDDDDDDDAASVAAPKPPAKRGRGGKAAAGTTRKTAAATKKAPAKTTGGRGKKKQVSEDEEDDDDDVIMLDDNDDDDDEEEERQSQGLFVSEKKKAPAPKAAATRASKAPAKTSTRNGKAAATGRQTHLNFSSQANGTRTTGGRAAAPKRLQEPSEDEISDDDAFEPAVPAARRR